MAMGLKYTLEASISDFETQANKRKEKQDCRLIPIHKQNKQTKSGNFIPVAEQVLLTTIAYW